MGDIKDLFVVKEFCDKELIYYDIQSLIKDIQIQYCPVLTEYEKQYYNFFQMFYEEIEITNWRIQIIFLENLLYKCKKTLSFICGCIKLALHLSNESLSIVFFPDTSSRIDIWVKDNVDSPIQIIKKKKIKQGEEIADNIQLYVNDENKMYFFIKDVVLPLIKECPISGMFGIEECYYTEEKDGEWFIDTKGSNYREIINHPLIDSKKCKSNNVWDIYEIFGIGAAKNFFRRRIWKKY